METYRSACISHPDIVKFARDLADLFNTWVENIGYRDRIPELSEKDREYLLGKIRDRLDTLVKATEQVTMPNPVSIGVARHDIGMSVSELS